jgi:WD40 repeat protein
MQADYEYDLFISYAEADRAWVEGYLLDALTQADVRVHSEAAFALGAPRLLEFERAVKDSQRALLVLSPAYLAENFTQFTDLLVQSYGLETATWPVIPLILHPVELPTRLSMLTHLDAVDPERWSEVIEHLCMELQRPVPGPPPKPPCPYPGMVPFCEEDTRFFYGREDEIQQLLRHLRHYICIWIIGPSGSGKSSLISAGLVPRLREREPDQWLVRSMRPGPDPMWSLRDALGASPPEASQDSEAYDEIVASTLAKDPPAIHLLLVVDQLEEVFTQAGKPRQTGFFAALHALHEVEACTLMLVMRADFYPDLMNSDLWPVDAGQRLEIAPLRGEALRQCIQRPAANVGVHLEAGLLERLLADSADEPGALPLVQETMVLLWGEMQRRLLPLSAYEQLGGAGRNGLTVAIAEKADATLSQLSPEGQTIARRIFLRLVQFSEGRADTRRQQPVSALRAAGDDPARFEATLRHLTDHRLLTLRGEKGDPDRRVDLAHEALIGDWPRLKTWLAERREAEQIRRRLETRAEDWQRLGRGEGGLLDEVELLEAERWVGSQVGSDLGHSEAVSELMTASRIAQEERVTRQRRVARFLLGAAAAIVALIVVVLGIGLWSAQQNARNQGAIAEREKRLAQQEREAAETAQAYAIVQENLAVAEAEARADAEERREEAERLRFVSIVRALAAQAPRQQIQTRDERGILLARQAYLFAQKGEVQVFDEVDSGLRESLSVPYLRHTLDSRGGSVLSLAFSPNGKKLAVGEIDDLKVWDFGQSVPSSVSLHQGTDIKAVAYAASGQILASGDEEGTVRLWDVDKPDIVPVVLTGHDGEVTSVAFSPDEQTLASSSKDGTIRLWDVRRTDTAPVIFSGHDGEVTSMAFSPDGKTLVSAGQDGAVRQWDIHHPIAEHDVLYSSNERINTIAFSPDGKMLAWGDSSGLVQVLTLPESQNDEALIETLWGHQGSITSVAFSPDSLELASGSVDATVRIWSTSRLDSQPTVLSGSKDQVFSIAFSPDGKKLAAGGTLGGIVWIWDMSEPYGTPQILKNYNVKVLAMALGPDGQMLATAGEYGPVLLWDLSRPSATVLHGPKTAPWPRSISFSSSGKKLASNGDDGTVQLWDLRQLAAEPKILNSGEEDVFSVALSPDGQLLAAGSFGGTVLVWDLREPDSVPVILGDHEEPVWSLVFSSDGKMLISGGDDSTIRLWNLDKPGNEPTVIDNTGQVQAMALSPDGRMLASGDWLGEIRLWDLREPALTPIILTGHEGEVLSLAFGSDSQVLASGSGSPPLKDLTDNTVRVWNLRDISAPPVILRGHEDRVTGVSFSPDGKTLVSSSEDGTIRIWPRTETIAEVVCEEKAWRNLTLEEWHEFVGVDIPYELTCPNLPLHPTFLEPARDLAREGRIEDATVIVERAFELDPSLENDASIWNTLCWYGSLWGHATEVMGACDRAVELAPDSGQIRDSRGVARALTGDYEGAIEDFESYLEWSKNSGGYEPRDLKRESWIIDLKAGQNPFDEAVLEELLH